MRKTLLLFVLAAAAFGQTSYRAPRAGDGHPQLSGIWQAFDGPNWDVEGHSAAAGIAPQLGATTARPPGLGVVEGGAIPYLPAALEKKNQNLANRAKLDPEIKCYLPGVPRANYNGHPFQIVQGKDNVLVSYQFAGGVRQINMGAPKKAPIDQWMGWSNGHWEGETLVVDVTGMNGDTWFDRAGNHHSDALHVVERYTPRSATVLWYEATIEDPKTFSRPWKIALPLYRLAEPGARLMEFKCAEFAEDFLYGHLRKGPK
jgi:hypothetical protein